MYIFDFDGTLLESNKVWEDIDEMFLGSCGVCPVPDDYTDYVAHHGFYESAVYTKERFALSQTAEEITDIWREMGRGAYGESLPLKPGARELLERLHSQGEEMILLTSCMAELCHLAVERLGLSPYFSRIFTAAELGMEKRNPEIYRCVATSCGVEPADCIFFDDAPPYCQAAKSVGMTVVGVKDDLYVGREEEMREICHRYLNHLLEY